MEALKVRARIKSGSKLEWLEPIPDLPPGEIEVILLYERKQVEQEPKPLSPADWPVLNGGQYLGGDLRREEIYDDEGR